MSQRPKKPKRPHGGPGGDRDLRTWGRTRPGMHVPVLLREVLQALNPREGDVVVDCTVGFGGHASEFIRRIGPTGRLIGLDVDGPELARTRERLAREGLPCSLHHASYTQVAEVLAREGLAGCDILFADVGVSSMQVDDPARGISYKHDDAPLDMRMDSRLKRTAADILAEISRDDLAEALRDLADEPDAQRIADWIVLQRGVTPLTRTGQLIRLTLNAKGLTERTWRDSPLTRFGQLHPAALTFQALRILVNQELDSIAALLELAPRVLVPGGRVGIISFHNGEDRLVREALARGLEAGLYRSLSPEAIAPSPAEARANWRSTSAKLRWALRA